MLFFKIMLLYFIAMVASQPPPCRKCLFLYVIFFYYNSDGLDDISEKLQQVIPCIPCIQLSKQARFWEILFLECRKDISSFTEEVWLFMCTHSAAIPRQHCRKALSQSHVCKSSIKQMRTFWDFVRFLYPLLEMVQSWNTPHSKLKKKWSWLNIGKILN